MPRAILLLHRNFHCPRGCSSVDLTERDVEKVRGVRSPVAGRRSPPSIRAEAKKVAKGGSVPHCTDAAVKQPLNRSYFPLIAFCYSDVIAVPPANARDSMKVFSLADKEIISELLYVFGVYFSLLKHFYLKKIVCRIRRGTGFGS